MIPILYKSTEKDFNHNGLGQMIEMIEATVTEQRNGEFEFYGEYPVSGRLYDSIDDFMFIKAKPNSVDEPHVFRIYEHELDITTQTVLLYATSKSNDLGSNMVLDVNINNETPLEALNKMKNNLIEPTDYMFYSDITTRSSTKWTRRNPLNCIAGEEGSLLHYWGGEIKRSNTVISLFSRRGKDNVTTIRHGKNLTGLTMNYSTKGMVTLIVPFFTHTPEGKDKEETIIGTHVTSQHINNYPLSYIKEVDYSQDDDVKDLATLNAKASKYFQENTGIDVPTLSATVNIDDLSDSSEYAKFKNLENIELTDTITVYAEKYKVNITAKVNSLTYDVLADKNRELEIGSVRNTFFDDTARQVKDLVREAEVVLVNTIQLAANGKNKIFRGIDEPITGMSVNDLWYKPVGSGETILYTYDGAYWQIEKVSAGLLAGTLDAESGDLNLINVNVSTLVGNISEFVRSYWNEVNSQISIDGNAVRILNVGRGDQALLKQAGMTFLFDGIEVGRVGMNYSQQSTEAYLSFSAKDGQGMNWAVETGANTGLYDTIMEVPKGQKTLRMQKTLNMNGNSLMNMDTVYFGDNMEIRRINEEVVDFRSSKQLRLVVDGLVLMDIINRDSGSGVNLSANINMQGNIITNHSDADLKENIRYSGYDALDTFRKFTPREWEWKNKERFGEQTEVGFIAQEVNEVDPTLVTQALDEEAIDGYSWAINETDMNKKSWVATHQLVNEIDRLKEENNTLKQEIEDIKKHLGLA